MQARTNVTLGGLCPVQVTVPLLLNTENVTTHLLFAEVDPPRAKALPELLRSR